jgi:hypothetical protein
MITNTKDQMPSRGDIVEKVLANKDRSFYKIQFRNGSEINVLIGDSDRVRGESTDILIKPSIKNGKITAKPSLPVGTKNTASDPEYRRKVAKLLGKDESEFMAPPQMQGNQNTAPIVDEDQARKVQDALERSQKRSERIAETLTRERGGQLESDVK